MRRVYREVRVAPAGGGWSILLDTRTLHTPARAPLLLPRRGLAAAIAAEWDAQTDKVVPAAMPLMQLAATAIDRTEPQRRQVIDEIVGYGATDLVCYRAERPADLVARQSAAWQPLLDWLTLRFDAPLLVTTGVIPRTQPETALAAIRAAVEALDPFWSTALHGATTACGSVVIGLALVERCLDAEGAWQASQLDESFQIEAWGEDAEAAARRAALKRDIEATWRFMELLRE
ncbi:MAG TPA: ATP12 family protein [Candidatus Angelobacter sp.]|nr:ATP12 family protein [Candidatus Angelobacter sp.]